MLIEENIKKNSCTKKFNMEEWERETYMAFT